MTPNPLSKDISDMKTGAPAVDRADAARDEVRSMSRIRRCAPQVEHDRAAVETVTQNLKRLLKLGGPGVPEFVVQVLHGGLGEPVAKTAWKLFGEGIKISGFRDSDPTAHVSVAGYCLANGTLDILRALVDAGVPPVVHRGMFGPRQPTPSLWLGLLSTTLSERNHPQFAGLVNHGGLVELAAVNHELFPANCQAALDLVWGLDPEHAGFVELVDDASAEGAVVRAFIMRKALEASAGTAPAMPAPSASSTPIPTLRARRAGI